MSTRAPACLCSAPPGDLWSVCSWQNQDRAINSYDDKEMVSAWESTSTVFCFVFIIAGLLRGSV